MIWACVVVAQDELEQKQQSFALPAKKRKKDVATQARAPEPKQALPVGVRSSSQMDSALAACKLQRLPSLEEVLACVYHSVAKLEDGQGRILSEPLQAMPERIEMASLPPFPVPLISPPRLGSGTRSLLQDGKLPNMAKELPSERELRSWDWESQQAFWDQSA